MKTKQTIITLAGAAAIVAGTLALAEDAPPAAGPAKGTPHRKWQDVPQPALDKFVDPKPVVATLKNGIKVFLIEDHELPTIDVVLQVHAGENDLCALFPGNPAADSTDPARAKAGLASIAGQTLRTGGTASKTGDELDDILEGMAASVETSAGHDQAHARMSCLKDNFDAALAIFADVVKHPAFREDKIALAKKQHLGQIRRRNDNPAGIAAREFGRLMYGDHSPLGWTEEAETIESVTRDDVVRFYETAFAWHPETALLGAVGDFDAAKMKAALEGALGDWKTAENAARPRVVTPPSSGLETPAPKPGSPPAASGGRGGYVYLVKKGDVNQSTVILGHLGIQRQPTDPDYPAASVANSILGSGGFAARLMQHVRTEMGLAYGCYSRFDASYGHQGTFVLQGQTKSGSTLAMAKAMRKELDRLVAEPPTAEELRVAKEAIAQNLIFSSERKSQVLDRALHNEFYGFPQDYLEQYQRGVAAVTADDVVRVAKKLFHPERLTTMIVGNDAEFDGKADELGAVTLIDVKQPEPRGGRRAPKGGAPTER